MKGKLLQKSEEAKGVKFTKHCFLTLVLSGHCNSLDTGLAFLLSKLLVSTYQDSSYFLLRGFSFLGN